MNSTVYNQDGKEVGTLELPQAIFGLPWNADLVHQVVNSMLSSARVSIAHAKGRGEVSGGGKKPWRQKGTGRARHGSIRSPIWKGGGVTHGPTKEKNYDRKVNKKAKAKALLTILSRKYQDGEIMFLDKLNMEKGKTKEAVYVLGSLAKAEGFNKLAWEKGKRAYITLPKSSQLVNRAFSNLTAVNLDETRNLNPVDALKYKYLIMVDPEESLKFLAQK